MSPAPRVGKVGKAQFRVDEDFESASGASDADAPKDVRRSDGSRGSGGFGSSKNSSSAPENRQSQVREVGARVARKAGSLLRLR